MGALFGSPRRRSSASNKEAAQTSNTSNTSNNTNNTTTTQTSNNQQSSTQATTQATTTQEEPAQTEVKTQEPAETVDLQASGSGSGGGDSNDTAVTTQVASDEKTDIPASVDFVTRFEIREMNKELQNRFFDCIDKMMETKNGVPGTSEFYRCASYHGNPPPIYCQHGRETFPGWHRIYLLDFEKAIQAADKALGNDGNIGLPYWDWSVRPEEGLPSIVRERFSSWPDDLFPKSVSNLPTLSRNNDSTITSMINSWGVANKANDCLLSTQHFAHASTGGEWASDYPSIESPHNDMHVIVGGNGGVMGSVAWAAFDIAFWLHHCNVDRIYESYLAIEDDSQDEMKWNQRRQSNNLYEEPFEPFFKDENIAYYPNDTFDTKKLGFVYNTPFPLPGLQQLRMPPTVALFPQVKVSDFESKCYQIHVFVVNGAEEEKFAEPETVNDIVWDSPNYAGGAGIFGRGMECENCLSRLPYDIVIDISKTIQTLQISRYDAKLKVYVLETTEATLNLVKLSDTPLPEPIITGPLFENKDSSLTQETTDDNNKNEVRSLQEYLRRFGYYGDEIDGLYGPITEKAVTVYQQATGLLEQDGKAGPLTKGAIRDLRRCSNKDPFGDNDIIDDKVAGVNELYQGKSKISYWIGISPAYISRSATVAAINNAFKLWSDAIGDSIEFELLPNLLDAGKGDIEISWADSTIRDGNLLRFDGPGGVLGHGGLNKDNNKGFVEFDMSERWVVGYQTEWNKNEAEPSKLQDTSTWYRGQPTISLYYTAVHEIGHALGLDHSIDVKDFMSPFYDPKKNQLSANDIAKIKEKFA